MIGNRLFPELSQEQEGQVKKVVSDVFQKQSPTIGLIGTSGTGKSSTINSLFKTELAISHVAACTKEFLASDLNVKVTSERISERQALLRVFDAPGLGEDIDRDPAYLAMYDEYLPKCDVILWVLTARNRAIALDQMYLKRLRPFADRMVFGINQVDLIEPMNWNHKLVAPSPEQQANLEMICQDRKAKIASTLGKEVVVIPYSAKLKFNLQQLFTTIIEFCPTERAWLFGALKNFDPFEFLPDEIRDEVMRMVNEKKKRVRGNQQNNQQYP